VDDDFRSRVISDGTFPKTLIDTLTAEEAAEFRKTGQLPKRTMERIQRLLKSQAGEQMQRNDEKASSVGAGRLYEELFSGGTRST